MQSIPEAVELTRQLLAFNTINPPGNERACAQHLGELLQRGGFEVSYHEFAPQRASVVARIGGGKGKPPLGFTGHIDVVPLGAAAWKHEPFAGTVEGGKLYGRGASDMKSGVAAFTVAALQLAERLRQSAGVVLVITADEECGCGGAFHLARERKALGEIGALVVGEPTANYPLIGHKGALWLKGVTSGVTAHGSMPEHGDNAVYKAAEAVLKLKAFDFGAAAHALMGKPTLNVGSLHGGLNINSVPDAAEIQIDIRTTPGMNHGELRRRLSESLGSQVKLTPMVDVGPVYTDPSDPWMQSVYALMASFLGGRPEPRSATYFTDAAALNQAWRDPPTVILGPGEPQMAHQTDEYCYVERIDQAVEVYAQLMRDWCA